MYSALPEEEYPHLATAGRSLYRDPEAAFVHGLRLMLDGLEAVASGRERAAV